MEGVVLVSRGEAVTLLELMTYVSSHIRCE